MSNFSQITFLGASVRSFNTSIGWGDTPSSFSVSLVEDPVQNDIFTRPSPGVPAFFATSDFQFGGLVQSWTKERDTSGNPIYNVNLQDPRELLDGVTLILSGYTGGVYNVPNIYNIYGYLESVAFGYSGINNTGIEWWKIRNAFLSLQNTTRLKLGSYEYTIDLSNLPRLPNYYRVGGQSITLMGFIAELCDAASCDFFFRLTSDLVITLYTVDRSVQPALGYIDQFVQNQNELVRGHSGYEFRNDTTSKFLTGGQVHELYFSWQQSGIASDFSDDTIAPYWGLDYNNNIVLGNGNYPDDNHNMLLDSIKVDVLGVGATYPIDVKEMRAALNSQESWELVLTSQMVNPSSVHYFKAQKIGMFSDKQIAFVSGLTREKIAGLTPMEFTALTGKMIRDSADSVTSLHEMNIARLYDAVRSYASEYYGRQFIINLSGLSAKRDEFTNEILTNWEPADGGYLTEPLLSGAIDINLLPEATSFITLDDSRISAFAKFENYEDLDYSELSPEDYRISKGCLFVRCELDGKLQFFDNALMNNARAIIRLPSPVYKKTDPNEIKSYNSAFQQAMKDILVSTKGMTEAESIEYTNNIFLRLGGEFLFNGQVGLAVMPDMVAVPLRSNTSTYGPWYAVGAYGKTEFESDYSLVPWNYGGYAAMNLAAHARVSSALTSMQIGENGSLEVTGLPAVILGGELIAGGPLVTDISCDVGHEGVKTTYRMQTWTPRFGKVAKQFTDRVQQMNIKAEKNRRQMKNIEATSRDLSRVKQREFKNIHDWVKRRSPSSSMQFIAGEYIPDASGNTGKTNVVMTPPYNLAGHIGSGYEYKAVASFDTLFTPFTTDPNSTSLPHFSDTYTTDINASSLNPFYNGEFNYVARTYISEDHTQDPSGDYKGIALRTPMILAGYGYDTQGNPVPGSGNNFLPDYASRPIDWKVGPLDVRWDDNSKCWKATGGSILLGKMANTLHYRSSGLVNLYANSSSGLHFTGETLSAKDWLLASGTAVYTGKNVMISFIDDAYYVIDAEPNC